VDLADPVVLRNLSEPAAGKIVFDTFKAAINDLTVRDSGSSRIEDRIRLRDMRPFRTANREYLPAKKSLFDKIVPEAVGGGFELEFAKFLDHAPDVAAFAKNYLAVGFKIDYVKADGDLSNYVPDFLVKTQAGDIFVVETKGRVELDLPQKMGRLKQWSEDASSASRAEGGPAYRFVFVSQEAFQAHRPADFAGLAGSFRDYQ
jgi:type III restriction enzyme